MAELQNPLKEAQRYLANAKQILSLKAGKDGNYYADKKYVKMAGNTAWNGILVALDAVLNVKNKLKSGQRPDFNDYKKIIAKKDKKMASILQSAYDSLHKSMGYDGIQNFKIVQESIAEAEKIIQWCEKNYLH